MFKAKYLNKKQNNLDRFDKNGFCLKIRVSKL